ncbi:PLDc N-terminal domain-containing protein [Methanohalobium evestigatum]|jgi:hypothetical protein|uniref:PLDc N-terminal domain-containing protein n=1 Tax=Methanohalobium evestigatum TaxID=2322 RepID=UPI000677D5FE|nr:PLDc N-terminal domain-containing protein [Methanohalobium evestigatum]
MVDIFATIWSIIVLASIVWVIYDVLTQNKSLSSIMKVFWIIIVLVLGIIGAILYYFLGKKK